MKYASSFQINSLQVTELPVRGQIEAQI